MTKEQFAEKLTEQFPDKKEALTKHYQDYSEMLGHVFFADEINSPLFSLLTVNENTAEIGKYCEFVEEMWFQGDDDVKNIVEVTILERLTDDPAVWQRFGQYISKEFRWVINGQIVPSFRTWLNVSELSAEGSRHRKRR